MCVFILFYYYRIHEKAHLKFFRKELPSLETLKARLEEALSNLV